MIGLSKVVALIPARAGSKGLPGKNRRVLQDKHLLGWPIEAAKASRYVDSVFLSTEDKVLALFGEHYGADIINRPAELASDTTTSEEVISHTLEQLHGFKYLVYLQPTSPLTDADDIDGALELLARNRRKADSIVGVGQMHSRHPINNVRINNKGLIEPVGADSFEVMRRQDVKEVFYLNGSLFITDIKVFKKQKTFYHDRTLPWLNPKWKSIDIDDSTDFVCVEAIMNEIEQRKIQGNATPLA